MKPPSSQRPPTFYWQAALILLPVIVLAVVGFVSLRQDRLLAEQEARERAAELVLQAARDVGDTLGREYGVIPQTNAVGLASCIAAGFKPIALISSNGVLRVPADYPEAPQPPAWIGKLNAQQAEDWHRVRATGDDPAAVDAALARLGASAMPAGSESALQFEVVRWAHRTNAPAAQALALQEFLQHVPPDSFSETGLPLWDGVALRVLQLVATNRWPEDFGRELESRIRGRPSVVTEALMTLAAEKAPPGELSQIANLQALWRFHETIRQLARRIGDNPMLRASSNAVTWIAQDSTNWLALVRPSWPGEAGTALVAFVSEADFATALTTATRQAVRDVPAFSQLVVEVGDRRFSLAGEPKARAAPVAFLAETEGRFDVGGSPFRFRVVSQLENPGLLYARQRERVQLFGALIGVSAVAAMIGLFTAWRAFRRQLHLAELKSNFVSSVSHELRAPIASVRLLAEGLQRGAVNGAERQREYHGLIVRECRRLSALIENVLDFARIEQGRKQYEFEPTDVGRLLRETTNLVEPVARERGVDVKLLDAGCRVPDGEALTAIWDGRAIQQALLNLLDNALKHAPPGSSITVLSTLNSQLSTLSLTVTDSGPGIPREDHGRIFERFYRRGSELRRETQGVGLGLAIVKHIAEAHGGRVRVESEPGKGATFTLELPVPGSNPETNQK